MIRALIIAAAVAVLAVPAGARPLPRGSWNARLQRGSSYLRSFRAMRRALEGKGGLVRLDRSLTTIVIPDLHGRRDYLDAVLATPDPATGRTYGQLLGQRRVQVLCLGDVMHTEVRGRLWRSGMPPNVMRLELAESLGTLKRIADLKAEHPDHFHLLRGNHDDVGPADGVGRCRLPLQIAETRRFLDATFESQLTREVARLFSALPTAAVGRGFVASHANPMFPVTRRQVQRNSERAVVSLSRARLPAFSRLRRQRRGGGADALRQVARALGDGPGRELYIHGHVAARPLVIEGQRVYFGNRRDRTFLRLDPRLPLEPQSQLFEAGTGRRVRVPAQPTR